MKNYQRLTIYLRNTNKDKNFKTTYTYNNIKTESDAISTIWTLHSLMTDNSTNLSYKIVKVTYNGITMNAFNNIKNTTNNGWLIVP
jgi:hypothetical protein